MSQDLFPGTPAPETALCLPVLYGGPGPQGKALVLGCSECGSWAEAAFGTPFALPHCCPRCIWGNGQMHSTPNRSVGALWVGSVRKVEDLLRRQGQREEAPLSFFFHHTETQNKEPRLTCSRLLSADYQLTGSMVHPQNVKVW